VAKLYFYPMACSLASRIAAAEAGVDLDFRPVDIFGERVLDDRAGTLDSLSTMGKVPVLVDDDGEVLSENAAVLQYLADLNPASALAPPPSQRSRYDLQRWLSFVGTELHKGFCNPMFSKGTPDSVKAWIRENVDRPLAVVAGHLDDRRDHLLGETFTVADCYLIWALVLIGFAKVDLARWPALSAYVERVRQRPHVAAAVSLEWEMARAASAKRN
jgi:glutathione S-transferase